MLSPEIKNALRVPRKGSKAYHATLEPKYALLRANRTRAKMVAFICGIGGYSDRSDRYAIEFNVKAHYAKTDVDHLWSVCRDNCDFGIADMPPAKQVMAEHLFREVYAEHESNVWEWGLEETRESWEDSDCPQETWTGIRVDWSWQFLGRQGGHLCMTECDEISLTGDEDSLFETLMERSNDLTYVIPDDCVAKLFIICVQNSVELTPRVVSKEVEYRAAWRLWASFCESELDKRLKAYEQREQLIEVAEDIRAHLYASERMQDGFKTLCQLAGINLKE